MFPNNKWKYLRLYSYFTYYSKFLDIKKKINGIKRQIFKHIKKSSQKLNFKKIESFLYYQREKPMFASNKANYKVSSRAAIIKNHYKMKKQQSALLFFYYPRHTLTNNGRALNLRAINLKQFTCMKLHRDKLNFRSGSYFILSTSLTIKTTHHSYR